MPTIPARSFATQHLHMGQSLKILNTYGNQVVDTWAFSVPDTPSPAFPRYMSMAHTRSTLQKLLPAMQESFLDNRRSPILKIVEDKSPGVHDVLFAACSPDRYIQLGASVDHANCADNLYHAVTSCTEPSFGEIRRFLECGWMPDPLNLFMNVSVNDGKLHCLDPVSRPGDYVTLRAEQECVVVMSACPMDLTACNGGDPTSAEYDVLQD